MMGFVIISHRQPAQLLRLIGTLNRLYGDPPIACHHDSSQSPISLADFPPNAKFVLPPLTTGWGKWAVTEAVLRAIKLLYTDSSPDWFVVLSAADYPCAPAEHVSRELASSGADAFIDFRKIGQGESAATQYGPRNPELWLYETPKGRLLGWRRYIRAQFWIPVLRRKVGGGLRVGRHTFHPNFRALNLPFSRNFECFHGDFWFSGSRKAAEVLSRPTKEHLRLRRYLRLRMLPEECYFQTVLCNEPNLALNRDSKRLTIWQAGQDHPKELGSDDLPVMLGSGAHFARKFRHGDRVLDELDAALDSKSGSPNASDRRRRPGPASQATG